MSANSKPPPGSRAKTPSLSAGAARALNKQPLTPKIAARGIRTPQNQTVSVNTPLARTPLQRSESALSNNRDEVASPLDAFLSNNITPRSGSRQSRASRVGFDSAGSTPTGTPNPDAHDAWGTPSGLGINAPSVSKVEDMRRPAVTFSSPAEARTPAALTRQDSDSKFFYASEATKSQTSQAAQQPRVFPLVTPQQQKVSTFFYANGTTIPDSGQGGATSNPPTPGLGSHPIQEDSLMSKFVYANNTRDTQPTARPSIAPRAGSVVSTASKTPVPRLGTPSNSGPGYAHQRPASPVKLASFSATKNTCAPPLASPRTNLGPVPSLGPASTAAQRRSIPNSDTPSLPRSRGGHSRHGSVTIAAEQHSVTRLVPARPSSGASSEASSPSNLSSAGLHLPQPTAAAGFASLIQAAEDFTADTAETTPAEEANSNEAVAEFGPQSPTKTSSQDQALTELVATARRERKVQDLEITNASLEAINRTLERQLRKQTAEIRRYRRLSRSGRLSLNSVSSNRVASDGSVIGGALARAGLGLDDLSEEEDSDAERDAISHDEEDDEDYDLSPSESGSAEISPGSRALRNARQRRRDEQRLQLDLSKHQQLLVDSQKINQSLRRCLGWTEELIKEGRRALEYKVRVSEIELGGRVLAPEEMEEHEESHMEGEEAEGEEETLHGVTFDLTGATRERWSGEKQDRDSGIDLPTDGG